MQGKSALPPLRAAPDVKPSLGPNPPWRDRDWELVDWACRSLTAETERVAHGIYDFLEMHDKGKALRKMLLYQEYKEEVSKRIQDDIDTELARRSTRSISRRRQASMSDYIRASNSKANGLSLDVIMPDYNPYKGKDHTIRFDNRVRNDPCKLELRKAEARAPLELGTGSNHVCRPVKLVPRLSVQLWDKLETTPFGRDAMPSTVYFGAKWQLENKVMPDHFNFPIDNTAALREIPKGKRCIFPQPSAHSEAR